MPADNATITTPARMNFVLDAQASQPLTQLIKLNLSVRLNEASREYEREQLRDARLGESGGDDEQRTSQLNQVLADQSRHPAEHAVIAGDFNNAVAFQSFMFAGLAPAGFTDALGDTTGEERRTSMNHRHPLDWMFVKGAARTGGRVERVDGASDHCPVVATIAR